MHLLLVFVRQDAIHHPANVDLWGRAFDFYPGEVFTSRSFDKPVRGASDNAINAGAESHFFHGKAGLLLESLPRYRLHFSPTVGELVPGEINPFGAV